MSDRTEEKIQPQPKMRRFLSSVAFPALNRVKRDIKNNEIKINELQVELIINIRKAPLHIGIEVKRIVSDDLPEFEFSYFIVANDTQDATLTCHTKMEFVDEKGDKREWKGAIRSGPDYTIEDITEDDIFQSCRDEYEMAVPPK
jgi:hypothetical protein